MSENVKNTKQKFNKKGKFINVITAIILIVVSFSCGFFTHLIIKGREDKALSEIVSYLKEYGVFDSETLELRDLTTEEIAEILIGNLPDDYATYYTPEEYKKAQKNGKGDYTGLGISTSFNGNTLVIRNVLINSPAYHVGLRPNDVISYGEYNGRKTEIKTNDDFGDFLEKIPESTSFILTCVREGEEKQIEISKEQFVATYVTYEDDGVTAEFLSKNYGDTPKLTPKEGGNKELSSDVAYIKLISFEGDVASELGEAIEFMEERGKSKLILDLRNNGGGYMSIFCRVSSYFINNGGKFSSPVAYAKDNKGNYDEYKSSGNKTTDNIKAISVIANENTASASECLIGAMLYYKDKFDINRLIIENQEVNDVSHTFGKGIMQTTYRLSNGGGLKLTTAIIYQPDKSTCIHGKGIIALEENSVKLADGIAIKRANEVLKG